MLHSGSLRIFSKRAASSAGRALRSQCRGQGFEPPAVHQLSFANEAAAIASSCCNSSSSCGCDHFVTKLASMLSNAATFRRSVGCVYRANMRVDEYPEIAITRGSLLWIGLRIDPVPWGFAADLSATVSARTLCGTLRTLRFSACSRGFYYGLLRVAHR